MPSRRVLIIAVFAVVAALCAAPSAHALEELAIGAQGAGFSLKGTDGKTYSLESIAGEKGTAVIFTCNECPYSKGYENRLIALAKDYRSKGVGFVAINSNDPKIVPGDAFEFMVKRAKEKDFPYPYLFDETQEIARAYGARVTPHIFLLDAKGKLVYRGRIDDSLEEGKIKERDLSAALGAIVSGQPIKVAETKAFGCGVKYTKK